MLKPRNHFRLCAPLCLFFLTVPLAAQSRVSYDVSFQNAVHHEALIVATFADVPAGSPLEVRMSRSSPGRYALHEFGRNVYSISASSADGSTLEVTHPDPYTWVIPRHDGTVRVEYTLFGSRADGTYSYIGTRYVHLNIPATFLWSEAILNGPVKVTFHRPLDSWTIATQLFPTDDPETFAAPDFYYFIDSPVHIGPIEWREWSVSEEGRSYTIRLAVDHAGTAEEVADYAEMAKKVVAEQIEMWGDVPDFDTGTYTFIATYLPSVSGDGMEHRNSTVLTSRRTLETEAERNLGTVSHEFFHAWNVERLRPASLEPFDLTRANMSGELWFAEGVTSYYDRLFIRRAQISDDEKWAEDLGYTVNAVVNSPAYRFRSPVESSRYAPFADAARAVDPNNWRNTFLSYYVAGAGIGLGLDLTLRERFGLTLDDLMREMWVRYGREEIPYTNEDVERALADLTTAEFAADFFARFVEGHQTVDYGPLLERAGFLLRKKNPGRSWLGAGVEDEDGRVVVSDRTLIGSPFYEAGIEEGDVIVKVDGRDVTGAAYLQGVADFVAPGTTLEVELDRHGETVATTVTLAESPELEVVTFESIDRELTEEQKKFRRLWLD